MIIICFGSLPSSYSSACCSPSSSSYCSWPTQAHWLWSRLSTLRNQKNTINSSHHIHAKSTSQSVLIDVRVVVSEYSLTCIVLEEYVGLPACTTAGGAQHQKQPEFIASYPAPLSSSKHAACPQDYEAALDYLSTVATVSTVLSGGILPEWTSSIFQLNSSLLFLATLWGAASASSSHLWMHFCQGHPPIRVSFLLASWPPRALFLGVAGPGPWRWMRNWNSIKWPWNIPIDLCEGH